MKTLILSLLVLSSWARAEQAVTLNFNNVSLTSQEKGAAMVDLTAEIKRQSPSTKIVGQKIKTVEVGGQPSFLGATVILLVSGQALDSQTLEAGSAQAVVLTNRFARSPGTWSLAVRGQMNLQQIKIVLDDEDAKSSVELDPMVRNDMNNAPTTESPTSPTGPIVRNGSDVSNAGFTMGETLIAVSSTSGLIDYVTFLSDDGDGLYTIQYDDQAIPRWTRNQLAKTDGCGGDICVGQTFSRLGDDLTVVGILNGDRFVLQKANQKFVVMSRANLKPGSAPAKPVAPATPTAKPAPAPAPVVVKPAPVAPAQTSNGRYRVGQRVLLVLDARQVYNARIQAIRGNATDVALDDGSVRTITRQEQIALTSGCAGGFCIGDQVQSYSADGRYVEGTIIALQSNTYAVLSFARQRGYIGFWPLSSLQR